MTEADRWQHVLNEYVLNERPWHVARVRVLEETASTQDVAATECRGEAGLLVVALRQAAGRARLGRRWHDAQDRGVAMTLTVRAAGAAAAALPIATGVAVAEAIAHCAGSGAALGIRWPNDVVERARGRKIAGILIESPASGLYLVGIGVNVLHEEGDWPDDLRGRACSIAQIAAACDRVRVIEAVLNRLAWAMAASTPVDELLDRWRRFDVLCGRRVTIEHSGRQLTGVVEAIEPTSHLLVRTEAGIERLPAATTSLVAIQGAPW